MFLILSEGADGFGEWRRLAAAYGPARAVEFTHEALTELSGFSAGFSVGLAGLADLLGSFAGRTVGLIDGADGLASGAAGLGPVRAG